MPAVCSEKVISRMKIGGFTREIGSLVSCRAAASGELGEILEVGAV